MNHLKTWVVTICTGEETSMLRVDSFTPSIVAYHFIFDWALIVEPTEKLSSIPVFSWSIPISVGPNQARPIFLNL